jgi:hypothetical protein
MSIDWTAVSAIATGSAALATAIAASVTAWMASTTKKSLQQAEKHHQDSYRPILVIAPSDDAIPIDRSTLLKFVQSGPNTSESIYILYGLLTNIGVGPALNVRLVLRIMGITDYGISCELTPVPAHERRGESRYRVRVPFRPRDGFNDTDAHLSTESSWEVILEYEDVFGNHFHTIHSKNPQQPWTVCGRGSPSPGRPPSTVGPQSVRSSIRTR